MDKNEVVILLTACVNPNGMAYTKIQDSCVRLQQYKEALDWYLSNTNQRIVFVENTNYDISDYYLEHIRSGRLDVLSFQGNNYNKSLGKGYGEALIVEYAINNSRFLQGKVNIIKITGRLICKNVNRMAKAYNLNDCVYAMSRLDSRGHMEFNSQVFVAPRIFYEKYFIPRKESINDSQHYWFEHLLYHATQRWINDSYRFKEMWIPFKLTGLSGSGGTNVGTTRLNNWAVFVLHYIMHRFNYYGPLQFWKRKSYVNITEIGVQ